MHDTMQSCYGELDVQWVKVLKGKSKDVKPFTPKPRTCMRYMTDGAAQSHYGELDVRWGYDIIGVMYTYMLYYITLPITHYLSIFTSGLAC